MHKNQPDIKPKTRSQILITLTAMANNNEDEPSPSAPIPLEKKPLKRGKRHDKERAKKDKLRLKIEEK